MRLRPGKNVKKKKKYMKFPSGPLAKGFPGGTVVKNPPARQEMQKTWV